MIESADEGITSVKALSTQSNWLIGPLLEAIQRVDSEVNSNAIWDNPALLEQYRSQMKRDSHNSQYLC